MANDTEVKDAIKVLWGAGLRNSPDEKRVPEIVTTWKRTMQDIPGETLKSAANDYILNEPFWPSVAEFRKYAAGLKTRNGTPHESPFEVAHSRVALSGDITSPFVVTAEGWQEWKPTGKPPQLLTKLEALKRRDWETWTEDERRYFEQQTGLDAPKREAVCTAP